MIDPGVAGLYKEFYILYNNFFPIFEAFDTPLHETKGVVYRCYSLLLAI